MLSASVKGYKLCSMAPFTNAPYRFNIISDIPRHGISPTSLVPLPDPDPLSPSPSHSHNSNLSQIPLRWCVFFVGLRLGLGLVLHFFWHDMFNWKGVLFVIHFSCWHCFYMTRIVNVHHMDTGGASFRPTRAMARPRFPKKTIYSMHQSAISKGIFRTVNMQTGWQPRSEQQRRPRLSTVSRILGPGSKKKPKGLFGCRNFSSEIN
jgi:hypothetical protein